MNELEIHFLTVASILNINMSVKYLQHNGGDIFNNKN